MTLQNLSEEAQWFLRNLQKLQDDFAESVGAQIVTTDKRGELVTKMSGTQRVCKLIMATEGGKKKCEECYKMALSLVRTQKEPAFMDCYAGYASLWVPIKVKGEIVGSITGCGGRYDRGESQEELREKYSKLADELGIEDKEDFLKAAVDEVRNPITEVEMKKRAERLSKLVGILVEETALSEVFRL
ncbi:MAG: PocR ligand-binding domain-containing protein, partial [Patescibacteria group bacterium]|nr:PocR ligand-binding domain-containing protein [Patescibacteria group bacterium]